MTCKRCNRVATKERLYDFLENDAQICLSGWQWGWRCATCGIVGEWAHRENGQRVK